MIVQVLFIMHLHQSPFMVDLQLGKRMYEFWQYLWFCFSFQPNDVSLDDGVSVAAFSFQTKALFMILEKWFDSKIMKL